MTTRPPTELEIAEGAWSLYVKTGDGAYIDNMTPDEMRALLRRPLVDRMADLADEIADPLICRTPAYGAPGHAHCAACCYGTGVIITCEEEQAAMDAARALHKAVDLIRGNAR